MKEKLPFLIFSISSAFLAYWLGFATSSFGWPPNDQIVSSYWQMVDLRKYWRNDIGLEPTRFLVPAPSTATSSTEGPPAPMAEGYRLVSGYMQDRPALHGAVLLGPEGDEVHFWSIDYKSLDPGGKDPKKVFLHGLEVFPDGSIMVNFDAGNAIARIGACGDVMWSRSGDFHHAIAHSHDGTVWSLEDEGLTQLDPDTGTTLRHVGLEEIIAANRAAGVFGMRFQDEEFEPGYMDDPFHPNDVEILSPEYAGAFRDFEAGDIMISLRSLNLVAVIDGEDLALKWYQHGPWHRQHDPDFLPDGTISVFDNNMHGEFSRIIKIDPVTRQHEILFEGSEKVPFYTWIRGKHEHLPNGNILVTEPQGGRVLEVDSAGNAVWEYRNAFDDGRNLLLNKAMLLSPDFFEPDVFAGCNDDLVATNTAP
jgi:hypothetical protein